MTPPAELVKQAASSNENDSGMIPEGQEEKT